MKLPNPLSRRSGRTTQTGPDGTDDDGVVARGLFTGVDRAEDQQRAIDRHVLALATGAGTGTGAHLHGIDVSDRETRRGLILLIIAGASGLAGLARLARLLRWERKRLNSRIGRIAFHQVRRRLAAGAFATMLPLGVGAVLGARANHRLARTVITDLSRSLH